MLYHFCMETLSSILTSDLSAALEFNGYHVRINYTSDMGGY